MAPHEQTWKQYRETLIRSIAAEYDCSLVDAAYCRTDDQVITEWFKLVRDAADRGAAISRKALDSVCETGKFSQLKREAPGFVQPDGYLPPDVRRKPSQYA